VQRNDDDCGINGSGGTPKYTVVYMAEHTCTANDSMEELPPVILETATVPAANNKTAAVAGSASSSPAAATTTGTAQSPATSDVTWSSTAANNNKEHAAIIDDLLYEEGLFDVDNWSAGKSSHLLVQDDIDYFTGPIRSPVHIAADSCWTIDQEQYLLVNEPVDHFSAHYSFV
jgi:hypothetical protein